MVVWEKERLFELKDILYYLREDANGQGGKDEKGFDLSGRVLGSPDYTL